MNLDKVIEDFSLMNTFNGNFDLEWPLETINERIIACSICFYPIGYESDIVDTIKNENNDTYAIVLPIAKLFLGNGLECQNFLKQWETELFCQNCGMILSFFSSHMNNTTESDFEKIKNYVGSELQIVILSSYLLYHGMYEDVLTRFNNCNNI